MSLRVRAALVALGALTLPVGGAPASTTGDAEPVDARADVASASSADSLPIFELDPIRILGRRPAEPLDPFQLSRKRFDVRAIERLPGANLGELLRPVAGVRLSSHGLPQAGGSLSIRGSTTDQVAVLVDGRRLGTAQGGGVDVETIALESVQSVEVVRGGASALWGGDALGGAIDVKTRPPRAGFRTRVAAGSFGERAASAEAGFAGQSPWAFRIAGRAYSTDGDFPFEDDDTGASGVIENGDLRRASGELRAERPLAGARLVLDASALDQDRGVPGSEEFPTPTARLADRRFAAGLSLTGDSPARRFGADVSVSRAVRRYQDPHAAFGPIDDEHENQAGRIEASFDRNGQRAAFRAATGVVADRLASTTDGDRSRDAAYVRAQASADRAAWGRALRFVGAARLDAVEDFAPFVSPRLGVVLDVVPRHVRFSTSAGLAFRAPSFDELFWPPRASAAGNPNLRPETGRDVDATTELENLPLSGRISVSAFARDVEDLIQWNPGPDAVWRPRNLGRARLAGIEGDVRWRVPLHAVEAVDMTASGTWLHSEDCTGEPNVDGKELMYRPRWTSAFSARAVDALGGELEALARATADVFVTRANTKTLPGYLVFDLRWRRPITHGFGLDASATNLTDVAARDVRDYPLPGRSLTIGISWEGGRR